MIGTTAAILGSAVIGAGASAISSSKAAKSAAQSSQAATDASTALQNKALETQQANTAVTRAAGDTATTDLLTRLGLTPQTPAASEAQQYTQYLKDNPDVAQGWQDEKNAPEFAGDINKWAKFHYDNYGKSEGRELPVPAAVQGEAKRPDLVTTPGYVAPTTTQTPGYVAPSMSRPTMDPLDVGLGKYEKAPDYEWQQTEARRGTLAGASATGALNSGAAAKALQDRAQQIAYGDYTNWRNYTTGQYNTDRSVLNSNFESDRGAATQNAQFGYNALVDQNKFKDTAAIDAAQFGYNALNSQNSATNQYNQQNFNTDRAFGADQTQQQTNNIFSLAGMGAAATGANNANIGANASNNSNALFSNASAQGNAALASAGQTNNAINQGVNALGYYFGNKGSGGSQANYNASVY